MGFYWGYMLLPHSYALLCIPIESHNHASTCDCFKLTGFAKHFGLANCMALTPLLHFTFQIKGFYGLLYVILLPFYTVDMSKVYNFHYAQRFNTQFQHNDFLHCTI